AEGQDRESGIRDQGSEIAAPGPDAAPDGTRMEAGDAGELPDEEFPLIAPEPGPPDGAAAPESTPPLAHTGSIGAPLHELEVVLGYTFKDVTVLQRAMVHRSYLHDVPDFALGANERLEFLGDAVLGFLVARWLYLRHPDKQEGELTALRGAL